jgi:hypothetical protein
MEVHHRLRRLRWTPDDVRRALSRFGVAVVHGRATESEVKAAGDQHFRTTYLDGEAQRQRKAMMRANEGFILGRLLRGSPAKMVAAAFMVTDVAIYNRAEGLGLVKTRTAKTRASGCEAQTSDR